ncbi:hypothetical protein AB0J63_44430 [Streptosporangium canum]|uniref:hypothetical protein n=1 Tax=Streptosporangium canum TaxID=324952 RepID=UPI003428BD10
MKALQHRTIGAAPELVGLGGGIKTGFGQVPYGLSVSTATRRGEVRPVTRCAPRPGASGEGHGGGRSRQ